MQNSQNSSKRAPLLKFYLTILFNRYIYDVVRRPRWTVNFEGIVASLWFRWILKRFESTLVSVSVTVFGLSHKVFRDHSMSELDRVEKPTQTIHNGAWVAQTSFFWHNLVRFVNIYILWNGLRKPSETISETIQNVMLLYKLIRIHNVIFLTGLHAAVLSFDTFDTDFHVRFAVCISGYELVGGNCSRCSVGSYKDQFGDESCTQCTGNRSTTDTGSTSATDCRKYTVQSIGICANVSYNW